MAWENVAAGEVLLNAGDTLEVAYCASTIFTYWRMSWPTHLIVAHTSMALLSFRYLRSGFLELFGLTSLLKISGIAGLTSTDTLIRQITARRTTFPGLRKCT